MPGEKQGRAAVWCRCECGQMIVAAIWSLERGKTRHCGCRPKEAPPTAGINTNRVVAARRSQYGVDNSTRTNVLTKLREICKAWSPEAVLSIETVYVVNDGKAPDNINIHVTVKDVASGKSITTTKRNYAEAVEDLRKRVIG